MSLIQLNPGRITRAGLWLATGHDLADPDIQNLIGQGKGPMMGGGSFTDYLENKLLDHIFGDSYTAPTAYLALWTSALTDASTGSTGGELTYTTYARQTGLTIAGSTSAAAAGSKTNDVAITFPAVTAGGGTVTFWGLCDALTVGNMLVWGTATSTVLSTTQTPPTVAVGGLVCTLD
jgi:hypothetical protein